MSNHKIILCAFCQGSGKNPYFSGTCPVCKGKGKNAIVEPFMTCEDCRGLGKKRGTSLTCYSCGGLGVLPDTREVIRKARKEIKEAREEMDKERQEFREKTQPPLARKETEKLFCQCCGHKVEKSSTLKVCIKCFRKIKKA